MYHLVGVDHNSMAAHLTRGDCGESNAVDKTNCNMLRNDSEEAGDARSEWQEGKGTNY